jgi:hypothetical protein
MWNVLLVGHLEGISSQNASPNSENVNAIADFLRFPGEICGNVGFKTQKQPIRNAVQRPTPISNELRQT